MFLHNFSFTVTSWAKVSWHSNCHYNEFHRCIEFRYKEGWVYLNLAYKEFQDNSSFSVHWWFHTWHFFWYYLFLISPSFGALGRLCFVISIHLYFHYENTHSNTENFTTKNDNFQIKISAIFLISATNKDCGYSLETPLTSTHNICFWAGIRKVMYTPVTPVLLLRVKFKGV